MELIVPNNTEVEKLNQQIATILKSLLTLDAGISELKSAVKVLQVHAATQLTPGNPLDGLKVLRALQKKAVESDPHAQENKEARELIDALQKWKKQGGGPVSRS
jgi:hypothetical protein